MHFQKSTNGATFRKREMMKSLVKNSLTLLLSIFVALCIISNPTSAFAASGDGSKDVSSELEFTNFNFRHNAWKPDYSGMELKDFNPSNSIKSYMSESAHINFDVPIPDDVKAGDYFIIDYGKYVRPGGIETPIGLTPLISEGKYITEIFYDKANNRVFHKFNENVEQKDHTKVHYSDPIWPKYDQVTENNKPYPIELTIGDKAFSKELTYDYGNECQGKKTVFGANINVDSSGDKKRITQVWHINRYGENVPDGNHTLQWKSDTGDSFESIKVYEVLDDRAITDSPNPNLDPAFVKEVAVNPIKGDDGKVSVNLNNGFSEGKKYIVITVANPAEGSNVSTDWLSVKNKDDFSRPQDYIGITIGADNSESSGNGEKMPGNFIENHRYELVDENGNVLKVEDTVTKFPQSGFKNEQYKTAKDDREGYKFVRTEEPKNDPTYNQDGAEAHGNYKPGKTQEITYVYQKLVEEPAPAPKTGSVMIRHVIKGTETNLRPLAFVKENTPNDEEYSTKNEKEIEFDGKTYVFVEHRKSSAPVDGKVTEQLQTVVYEYVLKETPSSTSTPTPNSLEPKQEVPETPAPQPTPGKTATTPNQDVQASPAPKPVTQQTPAANGAFLRLANRARCPSCWQRSAFPLQDWVLSARGINKH